MADLTKVAAVSIDGAVLPIKSGTFQAGYFKKIVEAGPTGPLGSRRGEYVPATVKATVAHSDDIDLIALGDLTGCEITVETEGGKLYSISGGVTTELGELKDDATFDITLQGESQEQS